MKTAILGDIHANLVAFQAVIEQVDAWKPDHVLLVGDLVNRGPCPAECLALFQERQVADGWETVRGNHEEYVISQANHGHRLNQSEAAVHQATIWTYQQLGCDVSPLQAMPLQHNLAAPDGSELRLTHGSMAGLRTGIYPFTTITELRGLIQPAPAVICVGHTHRALIRQVDDTLIVNAGSVGLPFDGDTRTGYAQLTWSKTAGWQAKLVRFRYDLEQANRDFEQTGYLAGGGPLVKLVEIELRTASSQLYNWAVRYQELALQGKISMADSVARHIAEDSTANPLVWSLGDLD
jgi:predicted phosphodiesterase